MGEQRKLSQLINERAESGAMKKHLLDKLNQLKADKSGLKANSEAALLNDTVIEALEHNLKNKFFDVTGFLATKLGELE